MDIDSLKNQLVDSERKNQLMEKDIKILQKMKEKKNK